MTGDAQLLSRQRVVIIGGTSGMGLGSGPRSLTRQNSQILLSTMRAIANSKPVMDQR